MDELEELKSKIEEFCKGKFDIFYCEKTPQPEESKVAIWQGPYDEFLKFGEKHGVKIIYFFVIRIGEDDIEYAEHKGEIGYIEIGYFIGDIYHAFIKSSEWFTPPEEEETEEEGSEGVEEIKEKTVEELSQEMIKYCKEEFPEVFEDIKNINRMQESFWLEMGIEHIYNLDPKLRLKIEKVNERVEREILEEKKKKEQEILPKLVEECVAWARKLGLNKVIKTNIHAFLNEKGISLTSPSEESLFIQVNNLLKAKK
jgi:hypothetical protein